MALSLSIVTIGNLRRADDRLIYNRVDKSGSTFMLRLLRALQGTNNFQVVVGRDPSKAAANIRGLATGSVYIEHVSFVSQPPAGLAWMQVVREPVARLASYFYYQVDPRVDRYTQAHAHGWLERRRKDAKCGCFKLEVQWDEANPVHASSFSLHAAMQPFRALIH